MNKLPQKYQIRVNPEQSAKAQELLFKHGYAWSTTRSKSIRHTGSPFLYQYDDMSITFSDEENGHSKITPYKQWRSEFLQHHNPATYLAELTAKRDKLTAKIEAIGKPEVEAVVEKYELKGGEWYIDDQDCYVGMRKKVYADHGVERQTKEAAERARLAIIRYQRLLAYVDEHGGHLPYKPSTDNFYIAFDNSIKKWVSAINCSVQHGWVYMTEACATQLAADLNSGRFSLDIE